MSVVKPVPVTRAAAGSVADELNVSAVPEMLPLTDMTGVWAVIGIDCVGEI
jgi:hypothetical protein